MLACALLTALPRAARTEPINNAHVRTADAGAADLLTDSLETVGNRPLARSAARSVQLADLCRIHALADGLAGRLVFLGTNGDRRYIRVQIECRQTRLNQVVALGHEMRHAVESQAATRRTAAKCSALSRDWVRHRHRGASVRKRRGPADSHGRAPRTARAGHPRPITARLSVERRQPRS